MTLTGVRQAYGFEVTKLRAQVKVRVALALCATAPLVFLMVLKRQSQLPQDTLFGRWVLDTGFATPLLVLGFAAQWVLPLLTSVVAGDVFSSEDHHGTWKTMLSRSRTRSELFSGKLLAAAAFTVAAIVVLGSAALLAGVIVIGHQPLVDLSGQLVTPSRATLLVAMSWLSVLPTTLAFASVAVLLSVWTRNSVIGVGVPVLIGLLMQLWAFLGMTDPVSRTLLTNGFSAWHGLVTSRPYLGPLVEAVIVAATLSTACLAASWWIVRTRDETG